MKTRPLSLTIIAWLLIVSSLWGFIDQWRSEDDPLVQEMMERSTISVEAQIAMGIVALVLGFVCGIGILKGRNWARYLYIGWSLITIAVGLFTSPYPSLMIIVAAFTAIIAFFLFRKAANEYFRGVPV